MPRLAAAEEPAGALIAQGGRRTRLAASSSTAASSRCCCRSPCSSRAALLGYHTGELRIDELLTFLRERYGIFIDQLAARRRLRDDEHRRTAARFATTLAAFTGRLREVGFYRDLSDAYVTQTITPRYRID